MKPVRLTFGGIGPYPGEVEIDFTGLDALGLYLIVGETGAGKSTIFDAMTYALYGELAGERSAKVLVSDHAGRVAPHVEFVFDLGGRRYCVRRTFQIGKKSPKPGDQVLEELGDAPDRMANVTQVRNVTEKVRELLGLDVDQFSKVVMLPQNKFQEFLLANDAKKEELLKVLFGTAIYGRIADELGERAKEHGARVEDANRRIADQHRDVRTALGELPARPEFEGLVPEDAESAVVLDETIAVVGSVRAALTTRNEELRSALNLAITALSNATTDAERFDATQQLEALTTAADDARAAVDDATERLDRHTRAAAVVPHAVALARATEEHERANEVLEVERDRLASIAAERPVGIALLEFPVDGTTATDVRQHATEARAAVVAVRDRYATIDRLGDEIDELTKALDTMATELEAADAERVRADEERATLEQELSSLRAVAATLADRRDAVRALDELLVAANVSAARAVMVAAQTAHESNTTAFEEAGRVADALAKARTLNLAGDLARDLVDDEACPVCGSTDHPAPAVPEGDPVDEVDLEAANERRNEAAVRVELSRDALKKAQTAVEEAERVASTLPSDEAQVELRGDLEQANEAVARVATTEKALEGLRHAAERAGAAAQEIETRRAATATTIAMKVADRDREVAAAATGLDRAAIDPAVEWCDAVLASTARIIEAEPAVTAAEAAVTANAATLAAALADAGFATADDARAALLDDTDLATVRATVDEAAARRTRIGELRAFIGDRPVPAVRPDLEELETAKAAAEDAADRSATDLATVVSVDDRLRSASETIDRLTAGMGDLLSMASRSADIAKRFATGGGTTQRLSLERWVQRSYFSEVCSVASERLADLSHGRYRITLEAEGADYVRGVQSLALFVTDAYTGQNRVVQTLSGGEQFLTSLSLALGLAEVVQRQAGGVDLGALFIDEGFGSLDGDTLDVAIDVLRTLRDSGRTIGVISHVESMQAELPIGLRVEKSASGSRVEVAAATE